MHIYEANFRPLDGGRNHVCYNFIIIFRSNICLLSHKGSILWSILCSACSSIVCEYQWRSVSNIGYTLFHVIPDTSVEFDIVKLINFQISQKTSPNFLLSAI
uniref:Uncharacterized protein n=1 Tax=Cacopsylla melanoneura TaxID=428564 RepID=A0A8D9AER9_9HEMI